MTKITVLQEELIATLEKLNQAENNTLNPMQRKRLERKERQIHQVIAKIIKEERSQLEKQICPELWQSPLLQNYLGIYKNQKGPYVVNEITAISDHAVEISATTTKRFSHHRSWYENVLEDYILLKLQEAGIFRYYERLFAKPEYYGEFLADKKAILSIKDPQKNNYQIQILNENDHHILIPRITIHQGRDFFLGEQFKNGDIQSENIKATCNYAKTAISKNPKWNPDYFDALYEESKNIDLLKKSENQLLRKKDV